jgi:hypothetical protein
MRTAIKKVLMLACAAVLLCSCVDYSKIAFSDFRVTSIDSLRYSLTDMSAIVNSNLTVDNPYFAMTLKDFEAEVVAPDGESLGEVRMDDGTQLDIAAKDKTLLEAPLRVLVRNPLKLLSLGTDAVRVLSEEDYKVNYSFAVSRGGKFYKINKKNVPLGSLIKTEE